MNLIPRILVFFGFLAATVAFGMDPLQEEEEIVAWLYQLDAPVRKGGPPIKRPVGKYRFASVTPETVGNLRELSLEGVGHYR